MWAISSKWLGTPGCPKTAAEMTNPVVAAKCTSEVLKTVGLDAWGKAAKQCKTAYPKWCVSLPQSPVCGVAVSAPTLCAKSQRM